jgi:hypothetical protein
VRMNEPACVTFGKHPLLRGAHAALCASNGWTSPYSGRRVIWWTKLRQLLVNKLLTLSVVN